MHTITSGRFKDTSWTLSRRKACPGGQSLPAGASCYGAAAPAASGSSISTLPSTETRRVTGSPGS